MIEHNPSSGKFVKKSEPFYKNAYFLLFIAGALFLTFIRPYLRHVPKAPDVQSQLSEFSFVSQQNKKFGSQDLKGHVYIANFIFTRCASICPLLTQKMAELRRRFDSEKIPILSVSFTVDPEFDTPEILQIYAEKYKVNSKDWIFLTAQREQLVSLIEQGFGLAMGEKDKDNSLIDISHAQKFAIVDKNGGVRGLYNSDASGLEEIFYRSQHVLSEIK